MLEDHWLGGDLDWKDGLGGVPGGDNVGDAAGDSNPGECHDPMGSPGDTGATEIKDKADG